MSKTREVRPFGARDKFGYLFGDLANDFSFIFASTYVMVFYTKVMGISAAMVGTVSYCSLYRCFYRYRYGTYRR